MSQTGLNIRIRLPRWARPSHPVYRLEAQRHAYNRGLAALQLVYLPALFAITGLALIGSLLLMTPFLSEPSVDSIMNSGLAISLIVVMMIQIGAGALGNVLVIAQTAPTISGEIELQSWRLLRTTTLPLHEIILAKFSAALIQLRLTLGGLMILRLITTITSILLFSYIVIRQAARDGTSTNTILYLSQLKWLPLMLPLATVTVAYLSQPLVQFFLSGALGMLASAYTRSRAQAIAAAFMVRLGLWAAVALANIAAYYAFATAISNWSEPQHASLQNYRALPAPTPEVITWAVCILLSAYAISIMAGQIGMTLMSLGLVLRRARKLGV